MHNRRAAIGEESIFWFFYIAMTAIIIWLVASSPRMVFSRLTDTQELENPIFAERIYDRAGLKSALTSRVYPGLLENIGDFNERRIESAFNTIGTPRRLAMKITIDGKDAYFAKKNYDEWQPLSPVRYKRFVEVRPVWIAGENKLASLTIDQVYMPKPRGGIG